MKKQKITALFTTISIIGTLVIPACTLFAGVRLKSSLAGKFERQGYMGSCTISRQGDRVSTYNYYGVDDQGIPKERASYTAVIPRGTNPRQGKSTQVTNHETKQIIPGAELHYDSWGCTYYPPGNQARYYMPDAEFYKMFAEGLIPPAPNWSLGP